VPACTNCVHRGDIVECSYNPRNHQIDGRPPRSPAQPLDRSAQDKLDHLERLVVGLLEEKRVGDQVATPANTLDASSTADHSFVLESFQDAGPQHNTEARAVASNSSPGISLCGNDEPRQSIDEARWASLLNGVRRPPRIQWSVTDGI